MSVVFWPKTKSLEIYLSRKDGNLLPFDINLWEPQPDTEITRLSQFLKSNHLKSASVLVEDNVVFTKTFIYDQPVTKLEVGEVIALAKDMVSFDIDPSSVTYDLITQNGKTLVQTRIFNQKKFSPLYRNLSRLGLKLDFSTVSESLAKVFSRFYPQPFFVFYPLESETEYVASLCSQGKVYLTSILKKSLPEVKKVINYSKSYFGAQAAKVYLPEVIAANLDVPGLEKTTYSEPQIAIDLNLPSNLPLPVAGIIRPSMENKKNLLPVIAVFFFTAVVAALIVWVVLTQGGKNNKEVINTPQANLITPAPTVPEVSPTAAPTAVKPSKSLKFQVLNATDINGQAATIKAALTKLGFTSVNTGNATEKVTANEIRLKPAVATSSAYFTGNIPEFATATIGSLAANSTYDVVFIIGTNLKATAQ